MPIVNLKKSRRIIDSLRLTTQRIRVFVYLPKRTDPIAGFAFVGDTKDDKVSIYLGESIRMGNVVQIAFDSPDSQSFRARTLICNRISLTQGYLGSPSLNFRATLQFHFASEFEREQFLKFHKELKERFLFLSRLVEQQNQKRAA